MSTSAASATASAPSTRARQKSKPQSSSSLPEPILADLPLAVDEPSPSSSTPVKAYLARKPLVIQGKKYKPGDEVPTEEILRVEGWVRAGYLNEVWR